MIPHDELNQIRTRSDKLRTEFRLPVILNRYSIAVSCSTSTLLKEMSMSYQQILSQYVVRSEINQRENNEDSFQVFTLVPAPGRPPVVVLAVADGMGGHAHGEYVSREALHKVSLSLFEQLIAEPAINHLEVVPSIDADTLSQALMNALEQANAHVRRMVEANKWGKAGSTIVVAALLDNTAVVVNLGDSPLFHYQASSRQLTKVTEDHTVAGVLLRAGMITPEMARFHEGRSRLEFYLGGEELPKEAPQHRVVLASGDLLLLCSDGVNGAILQEQIAEILSDSSGDLERMADRLLQASLQAGETDNQTLILWRHMTSQGETVTEMTPTSRAFASQSEELFPPSSPDGTLDIIKRIEETDVGMISQRVEVQDKRIAKCEQTLIEVSTKHALLLTRIMRLRRGVILASCLAIAGIVLAGVLWGRAVGLRWPRDQQPAVGAQIEKAD